MTTRRRHLVANHQLAVALGVAALIGGTWLIYDAYEGRGRRRPFAARLLPG